MDVPDINRDIKNLQRRMRRKRKREETGAFTPWCLQVASCIAVILGFDFKAATEWLAGRKRRGAKLDGDVDLSVAQRKLEDYVISIPDESLTVWTDPAASPVQRSALETAVKWSEGFKLLHWARFVNVEHGTPIRSELVASHFNDSLAENELAMYAKPVRLALASIKDWCHRWRRRHGAKYGFLRTSEHTDVHERREQASAGTLYVPSAFAFPESSGFRSRPFADPPQPHDFGHFYG